jgi:hypothetical protein
MLVSFDFLKNGERYYAKYKVNDEVKIVDVYPDNSLLRQIKRCNSNEKLAIRVITEGTRIEEKTSKIGNFYITVWGNLQRCVTMTDLPF